MTSLVISIDIVDVQLREPQRSGEGDPGGHELWTRRSRTTSVVVDQDLGGQWSTTNWWLLRADLGGQVRTTKLVVVDSDFGGQLRATSVVVDCDLGGQLRATSVVS